MNESKKRIRIGSEDVSIGEYHSLIDLFDKKISDPARGSKRKNIQEKYLQQEAEFLRTLKPLLITTPEMTAEIESLKKIKKNELLDLTKFTKEELRARVYKAEIRVDISKKFISNLISVMSHLVKESYDARKRRLDSVKNQKDGKDKKFKSNNALLMDCLKQVTENGTKTAKPNDFIRFRNLVMKTTPPFIQKPRRSKQDRLMSEDIQRMDAEAIARNEWAPSTIRNFFDKHSGTKASSVRK